KLLVLPRDPAMQEHRSDHKPSGRQDGERSEFLDSLRKGALIGVGVLALVLPLRMMHKAHQPQPQAPMAVATAPQAGPAAPTLQAPAPAPQALPAPSDRSPTGLQLADFHGE